ncbi:MAG: hypothetical protein DSM106950_06225 [Stigonema ocellatum SAG 48.90 = DSM 106950]|nr:hypothetical protein [Stigonema ocellatum SAG 48.90 = DSM 106950]
MLNLRKVKFTNNADEVKSNNGIFNPKNSTVNTLDGADKIIGTNSVNGDFGFGVLVGTNAQNFNSIIASAEFSGRASVAVKGINNKGIINTGSGSDQVIGNAIANIWATAETVSAVLAIANTADTSVISNAFASIKVNATADGIDNSGGEINNGNGNDGIYGNTIGSIAAVAIATADASAIVEALCKAPISNQLTAFAGAISTSIAKADIIARGINNRVGTITTGTGADAINATATSSSATLSVSASNALTIASSGNQALAKAVANAFAMANDQAIAIDNTKGYITTGDGNDTIDARAKASQKAIAIDNITGYITTGDGNDSIFASATGSDSYGIFGGRIDMGKNDDRLIASSFGGGVNIEMGKGNDFVQGFGDATVDGGKGTDILSLGSYSRDSFKISFGPNNGANFQLNGITMTTTGFEQFQFAGGVSYTYNQLITA